MRKTLIISILSLTSFLGYTQQSLNMTELSTFFPPNITFGDPENFNDIWGYAAPDGREYAIFGSREGTHFVDVTDPTMPVEVGFEMGGGASANSFWRDFKTYKHYAFGVADVTANNALQIFDLQYLPDSVVKIYDNNTFSSNCHNIHVNNDRLYLISNTRGGSYYPIDILCIEDPTNPYLIGGIRNNVNVTGNFNTAHDAFVSNDTVYLSVYSSATGNDGLHVFDFRDAENPVFLGSLQNYPVPGINHSSWMSDDGDYLIMADETRTSPLKIVDIQNLSSMSAVSTFATHPGAIAHNPFIKDCLAIISYYHDGVQIYDISDPLNPNQVGYFDTDTTIGNGNYNPNFLGCWGVYPYLPSGNILASDRKYGLFVLSYDGIMPTCSGDYDRVVEQDTTKFCEDTSTVSILAPNNYAQSFEIYPNPGTGVFNVINNYHLVNEVIIYDMRGVEVFRQNLELNERNIQINIQNEKSGVYILQINHNGGQNRLKLFKD